MLCLCRNFTAPPKKIILRYFALFFLRSNLKSNLAKFVKFGFKFYAPRPAPRKYKFKTRDALRQQSYVATLNFSFTAFATVASLETASLVTRRQQVASTKKSVVGGGIKGGGERLRVCLQLRAWRSKIKPHPLYNKVKNNLRRLFFT